MGKAITIPEDYTVDNANNLGTMTGSGSNYDGSNISISALKSKIGAAMYNLSLLAKHININKWAYFQSLEWDPNSDYMNGEYDRLTSNSNGYALGDFIGYNHLAKPPVYWYEEPPSSINIERFTNFAYTFKLARGEGPPVAATWDSWVSKDRIDFEYRFNSGSFNHLRKAMGTGSYTSFAISQTISEYTILYIKPYYYYEELPGLYTQVAMTEAAAREVILSAVSPYFNGGLICSGTGTYQQAISISVSITRTDNSPSGLYWRLYTTGDNVMEDYSKTNLGYISFSGEETIADFYDHYIYSNSGGNVTCTISLQCSDTSDFATVHTVATRDIAMSGPSGLG
ncbi:MAG: hypothetical protein FK734_15360 [Asgard group archaeon]|nr:hypothetical protein [Asgard group archaeon]